MYIVHKKTKEYEEKNVLHDVRKISAIKIKRIISCTLSSKELFQKLWFVSKQKLFQTISSHENFNFRYLWRESTESIGVTKTVRFIKISMVNISSDIAKLHILYSFGIVLGEILHFKNEEKSMRTITNKNALFNANINDIHVSMYTFSYAGLKFYWECKNTDRVCDLNREQESLLTRARYRVNTDQFVRHVMSVLCVCVLCVYMPILLHPTHRHTDTIFIPAHWSIHRIRRVCVFMLYYKWCCGRNEMRFSLSVYHQNKIAVSCVSYARCDSNSWKKSGLLFCYATAALYWIGKSK